MTKKKGQFMDCLYSYSCVWSQDDKNNIETSDSLGLWLESFGSDEETSFDYHFHPVYHQCMYQCSILTYMHTICHFRAFLF